MKSYKITKTEAINLYNLIPSASSINDVQKRPGVFSSLDRLAKELDKIIEKTS